METIIERVIIGLNLKQFYHYNYLLRDIKFIKRRTTYGFEMDFFKGIPISLIEVIEKDSYFVSFPENINFHCLINFNKIKMMIEKERFWEIHNLLEFFWRRKKDPDRLFLKGVIDICVSQVKVQMGQNNLCNRIMKRGELEIENSGLSKHIEKIMDRKEYPVKFTNFFLLYLINRLNEDNGIVENK
ncbi:DUF309 domain-containing protein [Caldiplasma sukawensis]